MHTTTVWRFAEALSPHTESEAYGADLPDKLIHAKVILYYESGSFK